MNNPLLLPTPKVFILNITVENEEIFLVLMNLGKIFHARKSDTANISNKPYDLAIENTIFDGH